MNKSRIKILNKNIYGGGPIAYWMSRDQRLENNWALIHAAEIANKHNEPLYICFILNHSWLGHSSQIASLMLDGLKKIGDESRKIGISFVFELGDPALKIPELVTKYKIGYLVSDFSPLKNKLRWDNSINTNILIPFDIVDAHNVIPVWVSSSKREFAAHTFRPKLKKLLPEYLETFPKVNLQNKTILKNENQWPALTNTYSYILSESNAKKQYEQFLDINIFTYDSNRNDPNLKGQSGLSPYLHFGTISAQQIISNLSEHRNLKASSGIDAFLEEIFVRRELSDNYCYYNNNYDNFDGLPTWSQKTLNEHKNDKRTFIYSMSEFDSGSTHDPLWNAAQNQMRTTGKMHGYMRMYWAKKILEWSENPEEAIHIAIYLNDKYEIDGRDPNGYTGIMWSIGGLHDRPWFEREIFGKVRYMNDKGCARKFDTKLYISKYS